MAPLSPNKTPSEWHDQVHYFRCTALLFCSLALHSSYCLCWSLGLSGLLPQVSRIYFLTWISTATDIIQALNISLPGYCIMLQATLTASHFFSIQSIFQSRSGEFVPKSIHPFTHLINITEYLLKVRCMWGTGDKEIKKPDLSSIAHEKSRGGAINKRHYSMTSEC